MTETTVKFATFVWNGRLFIISIITDFDSALGPPEPVAEGDDSAIINGDPHRQPHYLQVPHAFHIGLHHGGLALAIDILVPCSFELG